MTRSPTSDDDIDDLMRTRKLVARTGPDDDLRRVVDDLRQKQLDDHERLKTMWHHVRAMRPAKDWTETGIWEAVKLRMERQSIKIGSKLAWGILAGAGTLLLALITWIASHLAWKTT